MTGFYRDGFCSSGPEDIGRHTVCSIMTAEFLAFSKSRGNDLSTPMPQYNFPGLKPGDRWCLVAAALGRGARGRAGTAGGAAGDEPVRAAVREPRGSEEVRGRLTEPR